MKRTNEQIASLPDWVSLSGLCRDAGVSRMTLRQRVKREKDVAELGEALAQAMLPYVHIDDMKPLLELAKLASHLNPKCETIGAGMLAQLHELANKAIEDWEGVEK